jgi:translocation and assembly module TamB
VNPRIKKSLKWSGIGVAVLIALVVTLLAWVLFTTSGARWVAGQVTSRFATQVSYAALDGTIAGELRVRDFQFSGPPEAARIRIAQLSVDPTLRMLFSRQLRIENARVQGLVVTLPEKPGPQEPEDPDKPLWVEPPLDIVVDDFALLDGQILRGGERLFAVRQLDVSAIWTPGELRIRKLALLPGDIEGSLGVTGRVTPAGRLVRGEIDARWDDVVIPARYAGRVLQTQGELRFDGTPEAYAVKGGLTAGPPGEPTRVTLDVDGTDTRADIRTLHLEQRAGRLAVDGSVEFQPVAWRLHAEARDFNPGEWLAEWPGRVNLDIRTDGVLEEAGPRGSLRLDTLAGTLRDRPIAGEGALEFTAPSTLRGDLRVSSGRSRVAVVGRNGQREGIDANLTLSVASLADWLPAAAGSLNGDIDVRGTWPDLKIAGGVNGRNLAFAGQRVNRLDVTAGIESPRDPSGKLRLRARDVEAAGFQFASVAVDGSGSQRRHQVSLTAEGERLGGSLAVAGGITNTGWRGEVSRLAVEAPGITKLTLRDPAAIELDNGALSVAQACFTEDRGSLCVAADVQPSGALEANYTFDHVSLGLANAFAPDTLPGQLRGEIAGEGRIRRGVDGQLFGEAFVASARAELVLRDDAPGESVLGQRTLLLYENLELRAALEGMSATARLTAGLQSGGSLNARITASNLTAVAPGIDGEIEASLPTLAPFGPFVPTVANVDGSVDARILIGGTLTAPEITGNVDAQRLQADLGELGIELRDGRVRGEARTGGGFTLAASVASGKGHIELAGTLSERGVIDARVLGQNFVAADIPAATVIVTPDVTLTGDPKAYLLRGELTIPRADINLQRLPQDNAPGASPDVVVIRDGKEVQTEAQKQDLPLSAQVKVKLGENINIVGYGLEARVFGELDVRESPGVPTTGSGQLMVEGTYKKYGQDLTIKEGRLLFAGTPLDNPRLAIVAMREIDENLETGLRIAGSAKSPVVTVISDPNVGEADALSYLVTGRSLNDVGSASGGSQDALASATQSLQGAGAGLVAKRIGARLGLDEASVEENEMIGGSALTIGEYLSPRLYVSYGVGLFEPGEVIALRYKLSRDVGVRVQRGSEETRAGVEYRIEK